MVKTHTLTRAPAKTRQKILKAAFDEFYLRGFQAASVDSIIFQAGVTKGALYHHFRDKAALGHAVLEEEIRIPLLTAYAEPARQAETDPLAAIQDLLRRRADDFLERGIGRGCPLNNLSQEMSPLDESFRTHIAEIFKDWIDAYADALVRARQRGFVRPDVDARAVAGFIVAAIEGSFGAAKSANSVDVLRHNLEVLAVFLDSLRTEGPKYGD